MSDTSNPADAEFATSVVTQLGEGAPLADFAAAFEALHQQLQATLAQLDSR